MDEQEYKAFLEYLAREYLEPRLVRLRDKWGRSYRFEKWEHQAEVLRSATRLFRFAFRECRDSEEVYRTFRIERLRQATGAVRDGVRRSNQLADDAGILDCLDSHYNEIIAGLRVEHLPTEDFRVLSELGSRSPREDLEGLLYSFRASIKQETNQRHWSDKPLLRSELEIAGKRLDQEYQSFPSETEESSDQPPEKSRRWFKGFGQIGQGAALTIANVGLLAGTFAFPVSPETQTWGALTSATTGVGMVITGVGELRGE